MRRAPLLLLLLLGAAARTHGQVPQPSQCALADAPAALVAAASAFDDANAACLASFSACLIANNASGTACTRDCFSDSSALVSACYDARYTLCTISGATSAGTVLPPFNVRTEACVAPSCGVGTVDALSASWRGELCGPAWTSEDCAAIAAFCVSADPPDESHLWLVVGSVSGAFGACLAVLAGAWCYQRAREDAEELALWDELGDDGEGAREEELIGLGGNARSNHTAAAEEPEGDDPLIVARGGAQDQQFTYATLPERIEDPPG